MRSLVRETLMAHQLQLICQQTRPYSLNLSKKKLTQKTTLIKIGKRFFPQIHLIYLNIQEFITQMSMKEKFVSIIQVCSDVKLVNQIWVCLKTNFRNTEVCQTHMSMLRCGKQILFL